MLIDGRNIELSGPNSQNRKNVYPILEGEDSNASSLAQPCCKDKGKIWLGQLYQKFGMTSHTDKMDAVGTTFGDTHLYIVLLKGTTCLTINPQRCFVSGSRH